MDKQKCPECKASKYTNPNIKMMVNVCGHALCENCVDILFSRGSGACPQCKTPLRRGQFRCQMFEDNLVEKELDIRKRLMKDLNLSEDNFACLGEYNDYLEFVESAVFSLANEVDVEATKRRVEEFKQANADTIKSNRLRRRPELAALDGLIEAETSGGGGGGGGGGDLAPPPHGAPDFSSAGSNGLSTHSSSSAAAAAAASSSAMPVSAAAGGITTAAVNGGKPAASSDSQQQQQQLEFLDTAALADLLKPTCLQLNGPRLRRDRDDLASVLAARLPADYAAGGYQPGLAVIRLLADAYCDLYYRL